MSSVIHKDSGQRWNSRMWMTALSLVFAALFALPLNGQEQSSGSIKGTVKDPPALRFQELP